MFQHLTLYILGLQRNNVCSLPLYVMQPHQQNFPEPLQDM